MKPRVDNITMRLCRLLPFCWALFLAAGCHSAPIQNDPFAADRAAIVRLLNDYTAAADGFDAQAFAGLFLPEATFVTYRDGNPVRRAYGNEDILSQMLTRNARMQADGITSRHALGASGIEFLGPDRALVRTPLTVTWQYPGEPAPRPIYTGEYREIVVRTPAGWRFEQCEAWLD